MSRPRPLSLLAFGRRVANRRLMPGRDSVSPKSLIFVANTTSSTSLVVSPVTSSSDDNGAGARLVIARRLCSPPVICTSAIELTPKIVDLRL